MLDEKNKNSINLENSYDNIQFFYNKFFIKYTYSTSINLMHHSRFLFNHPMANLIRGFIHSLFYTKKISCNAIFYWTKKCINCNPKHYVHCPNIKQALDSDYLDAIDGYKYYKNYQIPCRKFFDSSKLRTLCFFI